MLNLIIIITLLFTIIYIKLGLFPIQIMIWSIVYIVSNYLIQIQNNHNKEYYIIRLLSIIVIIFILYYNSIDIDIHTALIIPSGYK